MEWFILSRDMHVLCAPSTDSPNSLPIFDDKQTILLSNNTVVSTYDFSVQQKHPDAQYLQMGNYVVFVDKYHKTKMYTLMSHDGDDLTHTWHAEDVGLDLLNEAAEKWDYTGEPHDIAWYLNNLVLKDSGWTIGINEASTLTRALKFDGETDTQLRRLGDIANQFDGAEVDFTIEMNGAQVTKQVVNIYKKVGSAVTQGRYIDSVNLTSLHSSGSIADLVTALKPFGAQMDMPEGQEGEAPRITIADVAYDDGRYYSPKGHAYLYDREARQQWSRFRAYNYANQGEFDGYIVGSYTYETKDPNELLNRALTDLKSRNKPSETYEAKLLEINADIGDYVQIAHNNYNPPIYLSARVEQVENCYTAKGQDTGVLGDYRKLQSDIDPRIKEMLDALESQIKSHYMWIRYAEDDKGKGMTSVPTVGTKYIAILVNKPTAIPSDDPADYAGHWQLIQGQDGADGIPGAKGEDGKTSYTHIAYANNVSGTADFSLDDPTGRSYMGVYVDFVKADSTDPKLYRWSLTKGETGEQGMQGAQGPKGDIGIPGKPGADGKTSYVHIAYADDDKGGGFSQSPANKAYMGWYSNTEANDSTNPSDYAWSLIKGKDGGDGAPGKPGADGKTPYFHQAWADSKDGKTNFSTTDPTNRGYLGTYTDFTQADSTDPTKYFWVELVGALDLNGRNLAARKLFKPWGKATFQGDSSAILLTDTTTELYSGLNIQRPANYKTNTDYVLSFDFQILTGTIATIGGHTGDFSQTKYIKIDGVDKGKHWGGANAFAPLAGRSFHFEIGMTTLSDYSGNTSGGFFIQPNRGSTAHPYTAEISNLRINQGNKDMGWQVPPEDTQQQIDTINKGLADTNSKIAAVPKVTTSKTAPTNPKPGDQWWVISIDPNTGKDAIGGFKQWNGTGWADSTIQQSLLNIVTLNAVNINGSVINGSKFTNSFDFKDMIGIEYTGVTTIGDGAVKIEYKIPSKNQTGITKLQADTYEQTIYDSNNHMVGLSGLSPASLRLLNQNNVGGILTPEDLETVGPITFATSGGGSTYRAAFFKKFHYVWMSGILYLKAGSNYNIGNLGTPNIFPNDHRYLAIHPLSSTSQYGVLQISPGGDLHVVNAPITERYTIEGLFYRVENL